LSLGKTNSRAAIGWRGFVIPLALLLVAELAAMAVHLKSDALARPSEILLAGVHALADGEILWWTVQTLAAAAAGLAVGAGVGLAAGLMLGLFPRLNRLMDFSVEAFRPIPAVALIPVALLVYGFGYPMEVALVAFSVLFPVLILTRGAVGSIEPCLLEVSRVLGLGFWARVFKIVVPAALPRIFVAFRYAVGVSLIVAVTVEISINPQGLGYAMIVAQSSLYPDRMFALLLWIGVVGWVLNAGLLWAQRRLFGPAAVLSGAT